MLNDTTSPEVAIANDANGMTVSGPVIYTFSFNEDVVNFDTSFLIIENATLEDNSLVAISPSIFTITVIPFENSTADILLTAQPGLARDAAGNESIGTVAKPQPVDTTPPQTGETVVFDLIEGISSTDDGGGRTFDGSTSYNIYIVVDSDATTLNWNNAYQWSGAGALGADDNVYLVSEAGHSEDIIGLQGGAVTQVQEHEQASFISWLSGSIPYFWNTNSHNLVFRLDNGTWNSGWGYAIQFQRGVNGTISAVASIGQGATVWASFPTSLSAGLGGPRLWDYTPDNMLNPNYGILASSQAVIL